jgi:hypothetical protein
LEHLQLSSQKSSGRGRLATLALALALVSVLTLLVVTPSLAAPHHQGAIHRPFISDVRGVQFVVSWTTDSASDGRVEWGPTTALSYTASDSMSNSTTHYVVIGGLQPSTTYYFQTRSGSLIDNNSGAFYIVTTGPDSIRAPTGRFVYGYVYQSNGTTPVPNAVVYLQLQDVNGGGSPGNSQWVTARTDGTGAWFYSDLGNIRTDDAADFSNFSEGADNLRLMAQGGNQGIAGGTAPGIIQAVPTAYPAQLVNLNLSGVPTAVRLAEFTANSVPKNSVLLAVAVTANVAGLVFWLHHRQRRAT